MDILNFEKKHVKEAMEIALANYYDERQYIKDLPQVCEIPSLYSFAENGLGIAAFEFHHICVEKRRLYQTRRRL